MKITGDYQFNALTKGFIVQRFWHHQKLMLIKRLADTRHGERVLDVGCGSGVVANYLAERGACVHAVDCNESAIRFARTHFQRKKLFFHLGLANEMHFPNETFHKIYCLELIEHMASKQAVSLMKSLYRFMARDGEILVPTPNYGGLWPLIEFFMDTLKLAPKLRDEQHITRFRLVELRKVLSDGGFRVVCSGRFCGLAPFASVLSWQFATLLDEVERAFGNPLGNFLYAVGKRVS